MRIVAGYRLGVPSGVERPGALLLSIAIDICAQEDIERARAIARGVARAIHTGAEACGTLLNARKAHRTVGNEIAGHAAVDALATLAVEPQKAVGVIAAVGARTPGVRLALPDGVSVRIVATRPNALFTRVARASCLRREQRALLAQTARVALAVEHAA